MTDKILNGRYHVVRHLAKGGMAQVYLAHDQLLDRSVAVKVLVPDLAADATFVERFRREAQAAAGLNHHNIVSVYDFGVDDSAHFIVMEYVDGPTLRQVIHQEAPLPAAKVVEIGAEIAAGLAAAHQQGIIHRDMKPANVLMAQTWKTEPGKVKVADFGIARAAQSAREALTMPGAVVGTATYLSPEQALGQDLDPRSDIYSLGMVLFEMLAGRAPFEGDSPVAVAYKQVNDTPPPPSVYNPDVPPALDAVVLRALAKDPADRQPTAEALRAELLALTFGSAGSGAAAPESTQVGAGPAPMPVVAAPAVVAAPVAPLAAAAATDATAITAGPPTSMMGPPTGVVDDPAPPLPPPAGRPPTRPAPATYRRRQGTVLIVVLLVAAVALIALVSALTGGGDDSKAETVIVPDVVNFTIDDAVAEVQRVGLVVDVKVDEDATGEADTVASQDPIGGATAKKGDKVKLVLPAGSTDTSVETTTPTTQAPATTAAPTPTTQAPATTAATVPPTTAPPATTVPPPPPTTVVVATTAAPPAP